MANCLIFYNICSLTRLVQKLDQRDEAVPEDMSFHWSGSQAGAGYLLAAWTQAISFVRPSHNQNKP